MVTAGRVFVNGVSARKASQDVAEDSELLVLPAVDYVSRAGHKLAHALEVFAQIDVVGQNALDVGASTGGFTDVLLTRGAARVYAVDSGTNQLAWKLRQDPRVIVHEQTSARILTDAHIPEPVDLIVCDASFIGLSKVLERPMTFAREGARLLALIKPQFEAGREEVGKGGVVRDSAVHARVCDDVVAWLQASGWSVAGVTESPITGPEGNIEFLVAASRNGP